MKKQIAFIMIFCLLFQTVSALAKGEVNLIDEDITLVYDMGLIPDSIREKEKVTRAEFAYVLASINKGMEYSDTDFPFSDITKSNEYYNEIKMLADMKVIRGNESGMFLPANPISAYEAAVMVIRFLGFEDSVIGGDYYSAAAKKGIFKGTSFTSESTLNGEGLCRIIYNLLNTDISYSKMGSEIYYGKKAKTYLEEALNIVSADGTVTDDGISCFTGESAIGADYIAVDGVKYRNVCKKSDLLGFNVTVYYNKNTKEAVSIIVNTGDCILLDASEVDGYDDYTYSVTENDRTKTYKIEKGFVLNYNKRVFESSSEMDKDEFKKLMLPELGSVMLIDTDGNGSRDYVKVMSYESIAVGSITTLSDTVFTSKFSIDKTQTSSGAVKYTQKQITISDDAEVNVRKQNGAAYALESIVPGQVICAAQSYDKKYADIIVCDSIETTASEVDNDTLYTADGEYELTDAYKSYLADNLSYGAKPGDKGDLYFTYDNRVVYFDVSDGDGNVFAMFDTVEKYDDLGGKYGLSAYTQNNEYRVFKIDRKTKIDGRKFSSDKDVCEYLAARADNLKYKLVIVDYNADGVLKSIDTPYKQSNERWSEYETENSLHIMKDIEEKSLKFVQGCASFMGEFNIDENTYIFALPENETEVENVRVVKYSTKKFKTNETIPVTAYSVSSNFCAEAVVVRDTYYTNPKDGDESKTVKTELVEKVVKAIGSSGEHITKLYTTDGYYHHIYETDTDEAMAYYYDSGKDIGKKVAAGDIVRMGVEGNVIRGDNMVLVYDMENDIKHYMGVSYKYPDSWQFNNTSLPCGYALKKGSNYLEFSVKDPADMIDYSVDKTYVIQTTNMSVVVFDKKNKTAKFGSTDDIIPYEYNPTDYSKIHLTLNVGVPVLCVIYK